MPSRQVVVKNFIAKKWQRLRNVFKTVIGFLFHLNDAADGAHRKKKKQTSRGFFGFIASLFVKKPIEAKRKKDDSQLDLPLDYDIELEYNMNHANRGIALILNHEYFVDKQKGRRNATDIDRDKMSRVLKRLHFNVKVCNDLTFDNIISEVEAGEIVCLSFLSFSNIVPPS